MGQNVVSQLQVFLINHISRTGQWNSLFKKCTLGVVKNVYNHSGHKTLKLTVPQKWKDEMNSFFCMLVQI